MSHTEVERIIFLMFLWEQALIFREQDYRMTWIKAEMGCQLRCVCSLVFFNLIHKRQIAKTPPNTPPYHHHHPHCHLLSSVTSLLFVIHQQVRRKAGQSLV